jgi:hypothetical protein
VYSFELRVYLWKVCVQFLAQSVLLEGLCTVPSSRMYHWKVGVRFLAQSVSLEGWCSVPSSECITRRLFLSLVYTRKVRIQFLCKNVWKAEMKVSVSVLVFVFSF